MDKDDATERLTVNQAAEMTGASPATVRKWARDGVLPTSKRERGRYKIHIRELGLVLSAKALRTMTMKELATMAGIRPRPTTP